MTLTPRLRLAVGIAAAVCSALAIVAPWWARVRVFPNGNAHLKPGVGVVGGLVVRGWVVGGVLVAIAVALLLVLRVAGRAVVPNGLPERRCPAGVFRWLVASVVLAALSVGAAGAGDFLFGASYRILQPEGPGGCRVVSREESFLFSGTGDAYVVAGSGIGRRVGTWDVDDGGRPIEAGAFELTWGADDGVLVVSGTPGSEVISGGLQTIDCG
ncbi:hypothetical protein [Xylanimonas protaetiae]|uniref:Uncharacterized protein n=1 Tax=Xylanimonas protaetiae TaxID=2509457 RepID=A0A4P6F4W6_9MICO|nr:hypothetical protein [Xylanimonas protaetiae]QAY70712.1 hypothetical protein ET471_12355 [Xylanimonas protaetiae]